MECPICEALRPEEMHESWCTYNGPEPEEGDLYEGWEEV